jgi:1-deoxy-D-xylulose-5-phosphate reductoisomerase
MKTHGAPKRIAILGASGSIGRSTLNVVRHWPDRFRVEALSAGKRWDLMLSPSASSAAHRGDVRPGRPASWSRHGSSGDEVLALRCDARDRA